MEFTNADTGGPLFTTNKEVHMDIYQAMTLTALGIVFVMWVIVEARNERRH